MKLKKGHKILVGLATVWVVIYPVLFVGSIMLSMLGAGLSASSMESGGDMPIVGLLFTGILFPLHCLTILMIFGLWIFYILHVLKNEDMSDTARILMGIGLFVMPYIVMPVYYYAFLWKATPPRWITGI